MQQMPPHPIRNPLYNKIDYIRNGVFASARTQFALLLEEGASLQQLGIVAAQLQGAIARAYHAATDDAAGSMTGPVPSPPPWNTFPDAPGDQSGPQQPPEAPGAGPNPFEV